MSRPPKEETRGRPRPPGTASILEAEADPDPEPLGSAIVGSPPDRKRGVPLTEVLPSRREAPMDVTEETTEPAGEAGRGMRRPCP